MNLRLIESLLTNPRDYNFTMAKRKDYVNSIQLLTNILVSYLESDKNPQTFTDVMRFQKFKIDLINIITNM